MRPRLLARPAETRSLLPVEARREPGALLVRVPRKVRVPPRASMTALLVVAEPMVPLPCTVAELVSAPPEREAVKELSWMVPKLEKGKKTSMVPEEMRREPPELEKLEV